MIRIIKEKYQDIQIHFAWLDELQTDITRSFNRIKGIRQINHQLQNKLRDHLIKLYKLKKKQRVISASVKVCEILKIILEASQAIDQLVETNNTRTAIEIIENTEKLIAERIAPVNVAL